MDGTIIVLIKLAVLQGNYRWCVKMRSMNRFCVN